MPNIKIFYDLHINVKEIRSNFIPNDSFSTVEDYIDTLFDILDIEINSIIEKYCNSSDTTNSPIVIINNMYLFRYLPQCVDIAKEFSSLNKIDVTVNEYIFRYDDIVDVKRIGKIHNGIWILDG
jgi:hypothetical protein